MTHIIATSVAQNSLFSTASDSELSHSQPHVQPHPLGIRPSGNALTGSYNARDNIGTFVLLPDEVILTVLEWLEYADLLRLGRSSRAFFAFTANDELWKELVIRTRPLQSRWRGSWRATYLRRDSSKIPCVDCRLCSDALYRPYLCSQLDLTPFAAQIQPSNSIPRLANLSQAEFSQSWNDQPVILTKAVTEWPVFSRWCQEDLLEQYGDVDFRAEAVDWPLKTYLEYMATTQDESPLYLFDRDFVRKMGLTVGQNGGAYWPPECFGDDLFALLGAHRPDSSWLIIGPERSGSTFHKDPNATSAWNAVIRGSKYWIMFPSSILPPGVFVSADESEVTSPLSIAEWLLTFHEEARSMKGCREGICHEGEVLHVPSGWWHLVVNLEPAIAITQNFIPESHIKSALDFLEKKPDQVSGFSNDIQDPYETFLDKLKLHRPELLVQAEAANGRKRKWQQLIEEGGGEQAQEKTGFSFGFADDAEDEIP
jgi:Cupin-like domain/F-box-like